MQATQERGQFGRPASRELGQRLRQRILVDNQLQVSGQEVSQLKGQHGQWPRPNYPRERGQLPEGLRHLGQLVLAQVEFGECGQIAQPFRHLGQPVPAAGHVG